MSAPSPLRIGILGAARIAPMALIRPAHSVPEVRIAAVAARDPARARAFAEKHGIPRVCAGYQALIEDPELDAIYNPLPNSLHCEWTMRALRAGKHVLCEKPIAANAGEAEQMAAAAEQTGRVLVEAFHWRYHPLAARMREVVRSGALGEVRHVEAALCIPLPAARRHPLPLRSGRRRHHGHRLLRDQHGALPGRGGAERGGRGCSPLVARRRPLDARRAELPGRAQRAGRVLALLREAALGARARDREPGELDVFNPIAPHLFHRLRVRADGKSRSERVPGAATYTHQLRAFAAHVAGGPRMSTDARDAVANMRVIDAVYDRAGMRRRGSR